MSCLSEFSLRRVVIVSIVDHFLLYLRFAETKTFGIRSKFFLSLIRTWTSTVTLDRERIRPLTRLSNDCRR